MSLGMLNRKQRRQLDKKAKSKLTNQQYTDYMKKAEDETVEFEVNRILGETWTNLEELLTAAMKENHISEDRIKRVFFRTLELSKEKFGKGGSRVERLFESNRA